MFTGNEELALLLPMIYDAEKEKEDFSHSVERARDIRRVCIVRSHHHLFARSHVGGVLAVNSLEVFAVSTPDLPCRYHIRCCDDCEVARDF